MPNIRFNYLYRDTGNYKKWSSVVFSNPDGLTLESVEKAFRRAFSQECLFIASQVRIPECFLFAEKCAGSDDHCFHEFDGVEASFESPKDSCSRSISGFIADVEVEAKRGWRTFDPENISS